MALSATFGADFNAFYDACAKAQTSLQGVDKEVKNVDKSFNALGATAPKDMDAVAKSIGNTQSAWATFAQGFDIEKAFQNPMGAAKDAIFAFTETLGPAGVALGAVSAGVAAVGVEAFNLASSAAATGAALGDMSDKTGMSVAALSRMENAAQVAGVPINTLTDAVFTLEKRMATGGAKFTEALAGIGTSTAELKSAGPDRYLEIVTEKLNNLDDPAKRAAIGTELLGGKYRELAAALNDLQAGYAATADMEPWTKEQADAAEHFGQQVAALKVHFSNLATEIGKAVIPAFNWLFDTMDNVGKKFNAMMGGGAPSFQSEIDAYVAAWDVLTGTFESSAPAIAQAEAGLKGIREAAAEAAKATELHVPTMAEALRTAAAAEKDLNEQIREGTAERKKAAAEHEKLLKSVQDVEKGVRLSADAFGLADYSQQDYLKKSIAGYEQLQKAQATLSDQVLKSTLSEHDYKVAKIREWEQATIDAFKGTQEQATQYAAFIHESANRQVADLDKVTGAVKNTGDEYTRMYEQATTGVLVIGQTAADVEAKRKQGAKETGDVVTDEFRRQQEAFASFKGIVVAGTGEMGNALANMPKGIWGSTDPSDVLMRNFLMQQAQRDRGEFFNPGMGGPRLGVATRAEGGPVRWGRTYLVGERGPELFRPNTDGSIIPNGGGGGGGAASVTNNFYINGSIQDLARPLMDEITRSMKMGRVWPAAS